MFKEKEILSILQHIDTKLTNIVALLKSRRVKEAVLTQKEGE